MMDVRQRGGFRLSAPRPFGRLHGAIPRPPRPWFGFLEIGSRSLGDDADSGQVDFRIGPKGSLVEKRLGSLLRWSTRLMRGPAAEHR